MCLNSSKKGSTLKEKKISKKGSNLKGENLSKFSPLKLKAPIATAADDMYRYFFYCFSEKINLDVSSESSDRQGIYMKNQALFSSKIKVKN